MDDVGFRRHQAEPDHLESEIGAHALEERNIAATVMTAHIAAPWIVRYGGGSWAWLMPVTGIPFGATFTWMTVVPLAEMWLRKVERGKEEV